jgi:hypothetical protein
MTSWLPLLIVLALGASPALAAEDNAAQKQQLAAERAAINSRHDRELAACAERFASNACRDAARQRQRQALADVQSRQLEIDQETRRRRATQRQAEIGRKQAEVESRSLLAPPADAAVVPLAPSRAASRPTRGASSAAAAKAAQRAEAARKRQQEIEADQARIEARVAKRKAQGKSPPPLPPAPGASGPT